MDGVKKAERIAEYQTLAACLLEKALDLPAGVERSAYVSGWLKMCAKVHTLAPDPCYKENRKRTRKRRMTL